jgi:hypothetical protein
MRVRVHADAQQRRDTVFTEPGTWLSAGGTANQLTGTVISHYGSLGAYNHVSVRLRPGHAVVDDQEMILHGTSPT